ncbi:OmpA family protein [Nitrospira lenta]|uniref:Putative Outer membrane protein, OmpA/MotB family n=1 Tax=Nitrospira lenta TaxID=1436998 RepID=A0A330L508_9BACT|nr:OmpA family protein [Nitrospira lenta]SPP64410.1 putative Outer membrane protein, OmpA/MotB family [Nitrospira lenta]
MKSIRIPILALSLLSIAGNAAAIDWNAICCDGGYEYRHRDQWDADKAAKDMAARLAALEKERQRLADELAAAKKENGALSDRVKALESQLADRDRELAALRSNAGDASKLASQLSSAQSDLSQSKARTAELERQLAATQSAAGGAKEKLAADLAATQAQLAALQAGAGDKDKLATELATAKQRNADLTAQLAAMGGTAGDKERIASELTACKQRVAELENMLADRDKDLAGLRGDLSAEMAKLKEAQRGLIRALRPQIDKQMIAVDLNNERLLINLTSGYLFGSGEDQLKPAGADALKQVGAILKDFPEYKVAVDGHTDNRPIKSSLKKTFPTNQELSEARAANAAKALTEGGLGAATTHGYADTKPVAPNTTDAGRAKNRRVEIRVTK